jgi:hypothetical protein
MTKIYFVQGLADMSATIALEDECFTNMDMAL